MSRLLKSLMTFDEYIAFEESAEIRHEFVNGQVFAINGGTINHNLICGNLNALLLGHTKNSKCLAFNQGMKIHVEATNSAYYPDAFVTCGRHEGADVIINDPSLIIEVLSKSTAAIDRREKQVAYMQIPSLQEYVIIDQRRRNVVVYRRSETGNWLVETYTGSQSLNLLGKSKAGRLEVSLDEIYARVDLPKRNLEVRESAQEDYFDWYPEPLFFQ